MPSSARCSVRRFPTPRWGTWSRTSSRLILSCACGRMRSFSRPSSASGSSRSRSASMPLVKAGQVVEDRYLRILDDAPIPDGVPAIIPAARLIADFADIARRAAPTGVLWPNNRKVSELAPFLDRLALVALVFPTFKDGRAYSQARQLRERYGFRGELRATGDVLRDQFLFLARAGFDAFEVKKDADAAAFASALARYSVFYQPTGDGRMSALRARLTRPNSAHHPAAREPARQ